MNREGRAETGVGLAAVTPESLSQAGELLQLRRREVQQCLVDLGTDRVEHALREVLRQLRRNLLGPVLVVHDCLPFLDGLSAPLWETPRQRGRPVRAPGRPCRGRSAPWARGS